MYHLEGVDSPPFAGPVPKLRVMNRAQPNDYQRCMADIRGAERYFGIKYVGPLPCLAMIGRPALSQNALYPDQSGAYDWQEIRLYC